MERFSLFPLDTLLRPMHVHGQLTPETYLEAQRAQILQKRAAFPLLRWRMPFDHVGDPAPVQIIQACWQLRCVYACGNAPMYDPEWQLAACYTCGAVYRQAPPADWRDLEAVLLMRPHIAQRNMLIGQTLADLIAENEREGDPVPAHLKVVA